MKRALPGATNTEEGKEGSRLCDGLTALLSLTTRPPIIRLLFGGRPATI